jgi:hypothetical protein
LSAAFLTAIATMPAARAQMGTSRAVVVTNGPQIDPGDRSGSWSAQQNVRDSKRYEAVVHANSSFRATRISKECGPINDLYRRGVNQAASARKPLTSKSIS